MGSGQLNSAWREATVSGSGEGKTQWVAGISLATDDSNVASGDAGVYSRRNFLRVDFHDWPVVAGQFHDCNSTTGEILLVREVLIACEKDVEAGGFSGPKQFAIDRSIPTHCACGADQMPAEMAAQFPGHILVEQDAHPADFVAIH